MVLPLHFIRRFPASLLAASWQKLVGRHGHGEHHTVIRAFQATYRHIESRISYCLHLSCLIRIAAVATVQVGMLEWVPNAFTGCSFSWYLRRVYRAIEALYLAHGPISLVAHSQGGIMALICLGPHRYDGAVLNTLLFLA